MSASYPKERPTLRERPATRTQRCRCGTLFAPGDLALVMDHLPPAIEPMLRGRWFCSSQCVRAELLEMFESLDAMTASHPAPIIRDLPQAAGALRDVFEALRTEGAPPREAATPRPLGSRASPTVS